jgi:hypothetical protein
MTTGEMIELTAIAAKLKSLAKENTPDHLLKEDLDWAAVLDHADRILEMTLVWWSNE